MLTPAPSTRLGGLIIAKAIQCVVADGVSLEQAVDEAIARIKQILSE
jgi:hypothetical protein